MGEQKGLVPCLGMFLILYLGFAYNTGSIYVFDSNDFMEVAVGLEILIAPIYLAVLLITLLYNTDSGKEFFRSIIKSIKNYIKRK